MKANKVTVRYANGDKVVVKPEAFEGPKRKSKLGKKKWQSTLGQALRRAGYKSYAEYLRSDHWRDLRNRYYESKLSSRCYVCGSRGVDLHHKTYKRLGQEYLWDLVPLCRGHHQAAHDLCGSQGDRNADLWWAARRLREQRHNTSQEAA